MGLCGVLVGEGAGKHWWKYVDNGGEIGTVILHSWNSILITFVSLGSHYLQIIQSFILIQSPLITEPNSVSVVLLLEDRISALWACSQILPNGHWECPLMSRSEMLTIHVSALFLFWSVGICDLAFRVTGFCSLNLVGFYTYFPYWNCSASAVLMVNICLIPLQDSEGLGWKLLFSFHNHLHPMTRSITVNSVKFYDEICCMAMCFRRYDSGFC